MSKRVFPFVTFEWVCVVFVVEVEDDAYGDDEDVEDGGYGGGFPPLPF